MASKTTKDFNRLPLDFKRSLVKEILPEYFSTDYPKFAEFLDVYYEYLDSSDNFGDVINDLYTIRDVENNTLSQLDLMLDELALGVSHTLFENPREAIRNFAKFFRVKGSLYSAEGFFRAFYGEDATIEYPKDDVFVLNSSELGIESLKVLQDGALYQTLSYLVNVPISQEKWGELYRKFVHPAGFYLGSEMELSGVGAVTTLRGIGVVFDSAEIVEDISSVSSLSPDQFGDVTLLDRRGELDFLEDAAGDVTWLNARTGIIENEGSYDLLERNDSDQPAFDVRLSADETIRKYRDATVEDLMTAYTTIEDLANADALTIDQDDSDTVGLRDISSTFERIDQEEYSRYDNIDSDSA